MSGPWGKPGLRWMLDAQERGAKWGFQKALLIIPRALQSQKLTMSFSAYLNFSCLFSSQQPGAFQWLYRCIECLLKPNRMIFLIYLSQKWCSRSLATSITWSGTWAAHGHMARWETQQITSPAHTEGHLKSPPTSFSFLSSLLPGIATAHVHLSGPVTSG